MFDSACSQLEHAKAHMIRLEHRLQEAQMRMNAAHASGTPQAKRDYQDASRAVDALSSDLRAACEKVMAATQECDALGADPEVLNEDMELASIAAELAMGGTEVVPFTETEDFLVSESAAGGFGADIVYRAHLDPLTQMLVDAGYDIMEVSPEARLEAQLQQLQEAGFLGDFGAETSLPRSRRGLRRLRRRLGRQRRRIRAEISRLPHTGRGRRRRLAQDPITQGLAASLRRRLRRVEDRLELVESALRTTARPRRRTRRRGRGPTGSVVSRPPKGSGVPVPPLTVPTDIADMGIPFPVPGLPGVVMPGPAPRQAVPSPGRMATPEVLEAPSKAEFSALLSARNTPIELRKFIREIRANIRSCKTLTMRFESRRTRDRARAESIRRRIARARRRSNAAISSARKRRLASIIGRLVRMLNRVNERILDHTRLLALAARAVPQYQSYLKRAQAKLAHLRQSSATQQSKPDEASVHAAEQAALEQDADVKQAVAEQTAEVTNTAVIAADNEALRDAAEGAQAELATKAEAGASASELAELAALVALLTDAINSQMPELISSIGHIAQMDLTPVFTQPIVPDADVTPPSVEGPTALLPVTPSDPLTTPSDIADQGIPVPSMDTSRPYRVYAVDDPLSNAAASYRDEREARLNAQLAFLAEQGVDISGHFGADPWDQFGSQFRLTDSSGQPFNFNSSFLTSGQSTAGGASGSSGRASGGKGGSGPGAGEVMTGIGGIMNGLGGLLGNILPWATGQGGNQAPAAPATVSDSQSAAGNAATNTPQVVYVPGQSPMATGQGGYSQPAPQNLTPLYVAGGIGLVGLGIFAWASSR